ncbi:unnamed protein product, partial [Prunus brigantina]
LEIFRHRKFLYTPTCCRRVGKAGGVSFCPDEIFRLSRVRRISRISIRMSFDYRTDLRILCEFADRESEPRMLRFNNSKFVGLAITVRLEAIPKPGSYLEIGNSSDHTQQAGPSRGRAAWDYLMRSCCVRLWKDMSLRDGCEMYEYVR